MMCDSGRDNTIIRCVEERRPDMDEGLLVVIHELQGLSIEELFADAEPGERIELTYREMTSDTFDALEEFEGW